MRATLVIEDSELGVMTELSWVPSGVLDSTQESVAMHLMANLVRIIQQMEASGALRVVSDSAP